MYITANDLSDRMSETDVIKLSNDVYDATTVDESVVNEKIDEAEDTLNGFVRGRYTVPLTPVTPLIKKMALDLAVHGLYSRRTNIPIPESVKDAYDNTIKLLKMVQKKELDIGVANLPSSGASDGDTVSVGDIRINKVKSDRLFGKDELRKY